ncbi:Uu.00g061170.m01.CDS01 [Anthostomella pinea]|uniref:Uu.00g061170.m01.CDS01 n=1 Tax=Anthostomella pinea TaxID=933095 RepID=A0AAI8YMH5_9PEZI|nr:Uu.00g061170.m01.CDS01 [Anthostomella pinea]
MAATKPSNVPGDKVPAEDVALETGASFIQNFEPTKQLCAHLNAFHTYADEPGRHVEANHYCAHLTEDVRQCILYDSPGPNARLIGIEYMITPKLYETLEPEERKLWHSHVFEVKSGMLIMPGPTLPGAVQAWEAAETQEMKHVIGLYGKVYHLWQTDRGDQLPLGTPKLMMSFTGEGQFDFEETVGERDRRFGTDWKRKKALREGIEVPKIHEDADQIWKTRRNSM